MLQFAYLLMIAVLAIGLLGAAAPTLAQTPAGRSPDLQAAIAAFNAREFDRAAELLRPLADAGDSLAMTRLGDLHRLGVGAERDDAKAYALYRAAADLGESDAVSRAAFMLAQGVGVEASPEGAAELYMRAAEAGDPSAQYNLALLYAEGVGVPQDRERARALLLSAAGQGHEPSLQRLEALPPGYADAMAPPAAPEPQENVASGAITQTQPPPVESGPGVSESPAPQEGAVEAAAAPEPAETGGSVEIAAADPAQDSAGATAAAPPPPRLRPARRQLDVAETAPAPTAAAPESQDFEQTSGAAPDVIVETQAPPQIRPAPRTPEPEPGPALDVIVETQAPPTTRPAPPPERRRAAANALEITQTQPAPGASQNRAARPQQPASSEPGLIIETQAPPVTSPESWSVRRVQTAADATPAARRLNVVETTPPPRPSAPAVALGRAATQPGLHIVELQPAPSAPPRPVAAPRAASDPARFSIAETTPAPTASPRARQSAPPTPQLEPPLFIAGPSLAAPAAPLSLEAPVLFSAAPTQAPSQVSMQTPVRAHTRDAAMAAGLAAYRAGAYAEAMRHWTPLAANRDGEALFRIGRMAARGEGRPKNVVAGYVMMRTALQCGYAGAQTALYNLAAQLTPAQRRTAEELFKSNMRAIAAMR